ncbi:hypothetical protein KR100_04390 [Synechococcus sp. KORDI-100]|nr:hypothetical protein KR100_04390 [Synechococcus sp. KORDI-100]
MTWEVALLRKRIDYKIRAILNMQMFHHVVCGTGHVIEIAFRDVNEVIFQCIPSFSNRFIPPFVADCVHQIQASEKHLALKNKFVN